MTPGAAESSPEKGGTGAGRAAGPAELGALVARRSVVTLSLTAVLFVLYYGYILLVAADRPLAVRTVGAVTPLAIPIAVGVIVAAWILTAIYVAWANAAYEPRVEKLRNRLE